MFEDREIKAIKKSMYAFYGGPPPEVEEHKVLEWAIDARINAGLLDAVLHGYLAVGMKDGEMHFSVTPKGERKVENLLRRAAQLRSGDADAGAQ